MDDKSVKKGLVELGVSVVSYVVVDAVSKAVKNMEREGKLSKKEGERMVREVVNKYQTKSSQYAKEAQSKVDDLMKASVKASPFATKEDIENLNAKIDRLSALSKKANASKRHSGKRSR